MRFRSERTGGYQVTAVSGTNTVSFAIDADPAATSGLLGFAVERHDPAEMERYYMYGFKVFGSVIPRPTQDLVVSTFDHPVQSFVWDDFTAKPGRTYEYFFHPLQGKPKNLDRSAPPVRVAVQTEPLFTDSRHDVFFNRGVLSSQAYRRVFGNQRPDSILPLARRQAAFQWLSRDLDEALLRSSSRHVKGTACCAASTSSATGRSPTPSSTRSGVASTSSSSSTRRRTAAPDAQPLPEGEPPLRASRSPATTTSRCSPPRLSPWITCACARRDRRTSSTTSSWCGSAGPSGSLPRSGLDPPTSRRAASSARPMSDTGFATRSWPNTTSGTGACSPTIPAAGRRMTPPRSARRTPRSAPRSRRSVSRRHRPPRFPPA